MKRPFIGTAAFAVLVVVAQALQPWQQGGPFIPGTKNDFGGSSTTEYGPLLQTVFPVAGPTTILRYENFNSGDMQNPCPVKGAG